MHVFQLLLSDCMLQTSAQSLSNKVLAPGMRFLCGFEILSVGYAATVVSKDKTSHVSPVSFCHQVYV